MVRHLYRGPYKNLKQFATLRGTQMYLAGHESKSHLRPRNRQVLLNCRRLAIRRIPTSFCIRKRRIEEPIIPFL